MLVSHKYRFIFLRTEKTGSTSLTAALKSMVDEDDLRINMNRPAWAKYSPIHHGALKRNFPQWFGLHTHATAKQARNVLGPKIFDNYYKFAVDRNPWERQVSLYTHREWKKGKKAENFDQDIRSFLYRSTEYVRLNNWSIYAIGKEIVADRVLRYENLSEEIDELVKLIGLPAPIEMPRLRSYSSERPHYSTYYSNASRELVSRWYAKEIEAHGYKFENIGIEDEKAHDPALNDLDGGTSPQDRPSADTESKLSLSA